MKKITLLLLLFAGMAKAQIVDIFPTQISRRNQFPWDLTATPMAKSMWPKRLL